MARRPVAYSLTVGLIAAVAAACGGESSDGDSGGDAAAEDVGDTLDNTDADATEAGDVEPVDADASDSTTDDTSSTDADAPDDVEANEDTDVADDEVVDAGPDTPAVDNDDDGVPAPLDCDDDDSAVVATNADDDGDGFSGCDGDCCDAPGDCVDPQLVNPAALELATQGGATPVDDDCDGTIDEAALPCDAGIALSEADATVAARALELCAAGSAERPGLLEATWVRADGSTATHSTQYGVSGRFGELAVPVGGERFVVLSSGRARDAEQPDYCGSVTCLGSDEGVAPTGWPDADLACPSAESIHDDAGLQLTLRAPSNATGFRVDLRYLTFDYPEYNCGAYADQAVVLMTPAPVGSRFGNIAFDASGTPLSVDYSPTDICDGCALGDADLYLTGFDVPSGGSATTWRRVQAPVVPGSTFTLRFVIWDVGGQDSDSTLLADNFAWTTGPAPTVSTTATP